MTAPSLTAADIARAAHERAVNHIRRARTCDCATGGECAMGYLLEHEARVAAWQAEHAPEWAVRRVGR